MKSRGVSPILVALVAIYLIALPAHAASRLPPRTVGHPHTVDPKARLLSSSVVLSWSDPEQLPAPDTPDNAYNPAMTVDPLSGIVHAVWEEDGSIKYALRDGEGWHLDNDLILVGDSPSIALDDTGAPHITYVDISLSDSQLQIFHCAWDGQEWTLPHVISGTSGPSTSPDIRIITETGQPASELPSSTIHVVWASRVNGDNALFHGQSDDNGATWHSVLPVPDAQGYAPRLAVAPDGNLWLAWRSEITYNEDRTSDIFVSHWDGNSWWPAEDLSGALGHDSASPSVTCPQNDLIYVAWEEQLLEGGSAIYICSGQPGQWSEPLALSMTDGYEPQITCDLDGNIHLAWDGGVTVEFAWQPANGIWQPNEQLGEAPEGLSSIALARERAGWVSIIWSAETAENGRRLVFRQGSIEPQVTETPTPTEMSTIPPPPTATPTERATTSATATGTATATTAPTDTPTVTSTAIEPLTPTATSTLSPTAIMTPTATLTITPSPTGTATLTATETATTTAAPTPTSTPTDNGSVTSTSTPNTMVPTIPALERMSVPLVLKVGLGAATEPQSYRQDSSGLPGVPAPNGRKERDQGESSPTVAPTIWTGISNVSASSVTSQEAAIAASGTRVYAVWVEEDAWGYRELCYSIYSEGTWSSPICFYAGEEPALTVSADERVHLTYANEFAGNYDVYYSYWTGSGWALPVNVSQTSGTSTQPAIACKSDCKPLIVWTDTTEGTTRIYHAWQTSGLWNTYLIPTSAGGSDPTVAVNGSNIVWVAWQTTDIGSFFEVYAIYGDGVTWNGFSIDVSGSGSVDSVAPRIVARGWQGMSMVWQEGNGNTGEVSHSSNEMYYPWWSTPEDLSNNASHSQAPDLAATADGAGFVAWDDGAAVPMRHQIISQSPWLDGSDVVSTSDDPGEVRLAADASHNIHYVWSQDGTGGAKDIYHRAMIWQPRQPLLLPLMMAP